MTQIFRNLFLLLIFNTSTGVFSQSVSLDWVKNYTGTTSNGTAGDYGHSICFDNNRNSYVGGEFRGVITLPTDTGIVTYASFGQQDIVIQKFDSVGNVIWAKRIGNNLYDHCASISYDSLGYIYVGGSFRGTVDFNPNSGVTNLTSIGGDDHFLLKLDTAGSFIWAKRFGGNTTSFCSQVTVVNSGDILMTGIFKDSIDFSQSIGVSNLVSNGLYDFFIMKLDSLGNVIWAKSIGGSDYDACSGFSLDNQNNIYLTGHHSDTIDFDPGAGIVTIVNSGTGEGMFILKLDSNGDYLWVKSQNLNPSTFSFGIDVNDSGSVYLTGDFQGAVDFNPDTGVYNLTSSPGYVDIFIEKFNTSGDFIWAKKIGSSFLERGSIIKVDPFGDLYITGWFTQAIDFDPGTGTTMINSSKGGIFLLKLDSNGEFYWVKDFLNTGSFSGYSLNEPSSFAIDNYGNIGLTGGFTSSYDFDPGLGTEVLSASFSDIFVMLLSPCSPDSGTIDSLSVCDSITWRDGVIYTSDTIIENYLIDGVTCDSLVGLNLNVVYSNTQIDSIIACNSYTWINGVTYTSHNLSDSYTITNQYGCDSIIKLNLLIYGVNTEVTIVDKLLISMQTNAQYQWFDCNKDTVITGETNHYYSVTESGSYAVIINNNGCIDTSDCFTFTNVGINEISNSADISVYPNPSTNYLIIDFHELNNTEILIEVYDIEGREIIIEGEIMSNSQKVRFDINSLSSGIYVIRFVSGGEVLTKSFIKSKF